MPTGIFDVAYSCWSLTIVSCWSCPAFWAIALGIMSSASAKACTPKRARPLTCCLYWLSAWWATISKAPPPGKTPVSYTHLDVYKRQQQ